MAHDGESRGVSLAAVRLRLRSYERLQEFFRPADAGEADVAAEND